ncbi:MAG: hypothetical protein IJN05_11690, partial [Ruminococcus sp.]|nr:hypothetical protein [Ruminococcus sp.]
CSSTAVRGVDSKHRLCLYTPDFSSKNQFADTRPFVKIFALRDLTNFACWKFPDPFKDGNTALKQCKQILICKEVAYGKQNKKDNADFLCY